VEDFVAFDSAVAARQAGGVLLWSGIALLLGGLACFAIDRRMAHVFHAVVNRRAEILFHGTTDWAKGALWLIAASAAYVLSRGLEWAFGVRWLEPVASASVAFLVSLAVASVILHTVKIVLGRRRPRDELELNLYGFRLFHFDLQSDSFPSGHALTIFCVAVILSAMLPWLSLLWFAIATYLALTRALLNSHFLSDVLVGAGTGLITTREVVIHLFPALARPWF
jgi:membrane-associated phospholipid phosphatase